MSQSIISLIIPNYNEESAIPVVLNELLAMKAQLRHFPEFMDVEVIVVDDGSSDQSPALLAESPWVKVVSHSVNRGYGAAIKTGIESATGQFIAIMDMDATYHAEDILHFSRELISENSAMIVGDRQLCRKSMPVVRRFGNWFLSTVASLASAYRIKDGCSGIRVMRADLIRELAPQLPNTLDFALALTLTMIRNNHSFKELPTTFKKRLGTSKLSEVFDGFRFLGCILYNSPVLRLRKN